MTTPASLRETPLAGTPMRAPVSWIREYVDLPADVTTEQLAAPADRARPQARGARAARRRRSRGPLVDRPGADDGGRAAEERQDHQLVHRRRRRRQRHRRAAGHRLRRAQLRARRPRRRDPARRCAARGLRDLRPQDLRPRLGRDDLLGPRARHRRGPRRDHRAARRTPASRATTLDRARPRARRSSSSRSTPTAPTPSRCAASPARRRWRYGAPYRDPAEREARPPNGDGYPVVVDDPDGCPVFVARTVTGFDPTAPTPAWMAQPARAVRACARSRWRSTSPTT